MEKAKLLVLCGVIGPVIYTIVLIVLGFLQPGYNHLTDFMSELGANGAANALAMNLFGFGLLGLLTVFFAFGLYKKTKSIGALLIVLAGAGLILTGVFPCDENCVNNSFSGEMHDFVSMIPVVAFSVGAVILSFNFNKNSELKKFAFYTLTTGILTAVLGLVFLFFETEFVGAMQRLLIAVPLIWIEVISIKLFLLASTKKFI